MSIRVAIENKEVSIFINEELVLLGRAGRLFYELIADQSYVGSIDINDLPPETFSGVIELTASYERVTVINGQWRRAIVCDDGHVKTIHNTDGKQALEKPGRVVRMVTYIPAWVNATQVHNLADAKLCNRLRTRYAHGSSRFRTVMHNLPPRGQLIVVDAGGWPGVLMMSGHQFGANYLELLYAGVSSDVVDPREIVQEFDPKALYCGHQNEFEVSKARRVHSAAAPERSNECAGAQQAG